jgi:hypothetical protein
LCQPCPQALGARSAQLHSPTAACTAPRSAQRASSGGSSLARLIASARHPAPADLLRLLCEPLNLPRDRVMTALYTKTTCTVRLQQYRYVVRCCEHPWKAWQCQARMAVPGTKARM